MFVPINSLSLIGAKIIVIQRAVTEIWMKTRFSAMAALISLFSKK